MGDEMVFNYYVNTKFIVCPDRYSMLRSSLKRTIYVHVVVSAIFQSRQPLSLCSSHNSSKINQIASGSVSKYTHTHTQPHFTN